MELKKRIPNVAECKKRTMGNMVIIIRERGGGLLRVAGKRVLKGLPVTVTGQNRGNKFGQSVFFYQIIC